MWLWRLSRSSLTVCILSPILLSVKKQPTVAASVTAGSAAQQSISAAAQMVLSSKAKRDSFSECKGREIFPHETPKKSVVNNTKTRKNAIVEYVDYEIPITQLKGPKGNGDMQAARRD